MDGKILWGGFGIFFLKNPSKLKKISQKGGGVTNNFPLNTPLRPTQEVARGILLYPTWNIPEFMVPR